MMKITIGGKNIELQASFYTVEKMMKKYDFLSLDKMSVPDFNRVIFDAIWASLPRRFFLKPFWTKNSLKKTLTMAELKTIGTNIADWLFGEGRELGNSGSEK